MRRSLAIVSGGGNPASQNIASLSESFTSFDTKKALLNENFGNEINKTRRRSIIVADPVPSSAVSQKEHPTEEKFRRSSKLLCQTEINKRMKSRYIYALAFVSCVLFTILMKPSFQLSGPNMEHPAAHIHRDLNKKSIECVAYGIGTITAPDIEDASEPESLTCGTENHGPTVMLVGDHENFFDHNFISGTTSLEIPTMLISAELEVDLDDPLAFELISISNGASKRNLRQGQAIERSLVADYHGFFKTLVVRVGDKRGHSPTYTASELSDHIFMGDLTMASQYRACSNDQLRFTPAFGGADIVNGVVDVVVDVDLSATHSMIECVTAADNAISLKYDVGTTHTYIMYICPEAVDFGTNAGGADVGGKKSWYSDTFGSSPFVQMHEIGHNLNFFHSGEGDQQYGDPSGVMGGRYETIPREWGRMCLNAAKTWTAGWYSDQHFTVFPTRGGYSGNIVDVNSIIEGRYESEDTVVVKVEDQGEDALYFMLHRLEGITSDIKDEYKDTRGNGINISRYAGAGRPSELVGHLSSGEEYIQKNWSNSGQALHIKVCSIEDHYQDGGAKVLVFLDGERALNCNSEISPPLSASPTASPTVVQTEPLTSIECQDSTLKTKVNGISRSCEWVAAANTQERCEKPGISSHCPATCTASIFCAPDSEKRFRVTETNDFKGCDWVSRKFTKQRCQLEGVASTCRETCAPFV